MLIHDYSSLFRYVLTDDIGKLDNDIDGVMLIRP